MRTVAELQGVGRSFDGGRSWSLRDIDLRLTPGDMVAVTGESGAGKSTLLNILGLLDRCSVGEYRYSGLNVNTLDEGALATARSTRIGFVFQGSHLIQRLTVYENLECRYLYGPETGPGLRDREIRAALAAVGLEPLAGRRPAELSGGEAQRVAIARSLVRSPELLLLDEPTGNLDETNSLRILEIVRRIADKGTSVVMATHQRQLADRFSSELSLANGVVKARRQI